ncbi:hypothetical protein [Pontibacter vulgaris]|uniref:hypothetical protein n=1 Tax=Pontibacter vulgaris TaxID=2905679 RepID=UPI001FA6E871|nr:hypothetical protein [Pontibacter vulgaris]
MKKIFFSVCCAGALFYTSCNGDRGTTTEVVDANKNEQVDPNTIRGYGNEPASTNVPADENADMMYRKQAQTTASMMATDMKLDKATQDKVAAVLYQRNQQMSALEDRYNYSSTNRMGGQAKNDTENDSAMNKNTNMDAARPNNAGNKYTGNAAKNDAMGNNLNMTETQMNAERSKIDAKTDKDMKAILTPEQYSTYTKNRSKYSNM